MGSEMKKIYLKEMNRASSIILKTEKGGARNISLLALSDKAKSIFSKALFQIFDRDGNNILEGKELNGSYEKLSYFVNGKEVVNEKLEELEFIGKQIDRLNKDKDLKKRAMSVKMLEVARFDYLDYMHGRGSTADLVVPELLEALKSETDKTVRRFIIRTLGDIAPIGKLGEKVIPEYIKGLQEKDDAVIRTGNAIGLAHMGRFASKALPNLREALNDPDRGVREAAKMAIDIIEGK